MQVIYIPREGDAFFGDSILDEKVGQPIVRLAPGQNMPQTIMPLATRLETEHYEYKGTIVKRGGQPIIAFYEQV